VTVFNEMRADGSPPERRSPIMSIFATARTAFGNAGMKRAEAARWSAAATLADLGELTAQWLEGNIRETPSYLGRPDAETLPLVPVLAAVNRAGFVTDQSQPGCFEDGWAQRAAVTGFADDAMCDALAAACRDHGDLTFMAWKPGRWRTRSRNAVDVTWCGRTAVTGFGIQLSRRFLRWEYRCCSRAAVAAVCDAWQVTIIDRQLGRNDLLWQVLELAIEERS